MDDIDKILRIIEAVRKTEDTKYDKLVDEVRRLSDKVDMLAMRQYPTVVEYPPFHITCGAGTGNSSP